MKRPVIIAALLAAGLALAGCTAAPDPGSSPSSEASAPAEDFSDISVYYPVVLGNSWTYRMTLPEPVGIVTETETMSAITPEGDGVRATIDRSFHYENGTLPDFSDSVDYIFHGDGSITVPYQSLPDASGSTVTVSGGEMVWPTTEEFEAGTPKTGTLQVQVTSSGTVIDQTITFSIAGAGVEDVTVPAGSYPGARKLLQNMLISIPSVGVTDLPINTTVWLAEGVGMVKSEVPDVLGLGGATTVELLEFTPGG